MTGTSPLSTDKPGVTIIYCTRCNWLLRAGWMAQELLSTFSEEIGTLTLTPDHTGGVFEIRAGDELIWSRKEEGGFPDIAKLKRLIRDRIAPERDLGHIDRAHKDREE
jgi:selenoprotein W-related protein